MKHYKNSQHTPYLQHMPHSHNDIPLYMAHTMFPHTYAPPTHMRLQVHFSLH